MMRTAMIRMMMTATIMMMIMMMMIMTMMMTMMMMMMMRNKDNDDNDEDRKILCTQPLPCHPPSLLGDLPLAQVIMMRMTMTNSM